VNELPVAITRIAIGACLLGLVAAAITVSGGIGLRGALGSLFGLHSPQAAQPPAAAPPAHLLAAAGLPVARQAGPNRSRRAPAEAHRRRTPRSAPSPAPRPAPSPAPQPPSSPPPSPPPAVPPPPPPQTHIVKTAASTIQTVARPLPGPVPPLVDQAVGLVDATCVALGGCP
jgi:hypothetical protein